MKTFEEWQNYEENRLFSSRLDSILIETARKGISIKNLWENRFVPLIQSAKSDDPSWLLSEVEVKEITPEDVEKTYNNLINIGAKLGAKYPRDEIMRRLGGSTWAMRLMAALEEKGLAKLERNPQNGKVFFSLTNHKPDDSQMPPEMSQQKTPVAKRLPDDPKMNAKIGEITKAVIDPLRQEFERAMKQFINSSHHNNFTNNPKYAAISDQLIKNLYNKVTQAASSALSPTWRKAEGGESVERQKQYDQSRDQYMQKFRGDQG